MFFFGYGTIPTPPPPAVSNIGTNYASAVKFGPIPNLSKLVPKKLYLIWNISIFTSYLALQTKLQVIKLLE